MALTLWSAGGISFAQDYDAPSFPTWKSVPKEKYQPGTISGANLLLGSNQSTKAQTGKKTFTTSSAQGFTTMSVVADSDADYRTPELVALAQGLKNDKDLIFKWVRDNIRYVHYYGIKKGAHLTYLERSGNDADQSALLVALWRAAGVDCRYVFGLIEMPPTAANQVDWVHYLGVNASELANLVYSRGTPAGSFGTYSDPSRLALKRLWVQANNGGTWEDYDPSFKLIQPVSGQNLNAMSGYTRANLLSSLGAGTVGTDSITGLSSANLDTYLRNLTGQFVTTYRNSYLSKSVEETVGGWKRLPNSIVDSGHFPAGDAGYLWGTYTNEIYDTLPDVFYSKIQIQDGTLTGIGSSNGATLNWGPVNLASLRGRRLGLVFEGNKATLKIDDTTAVQASTATASTFPTVVSIRHSQIDLSTVDPAAPPAYPTTKGPLGEDTAITYVLNGTYALSYGFDVSKEYLEARQNQLSSYYDQGIAESDSRMRLESLNIVGLQWMYQTEMSHRLIANLSNLNTTYMHRFGRVAQEPSGSNTFLYVDLPSNFDGAVSIAPDPTFAVTLNAFVTGTFITSAMEHGVLEQSQPGTVTNALSTIKILKTANDAGIPVFLANSANWSTVRPNLVAPAATAYSASDMTALDQAINTNQILLPKSGRITVNQWTGSAYATYGGSSAAMKIGGGLSGGYNSISASINTSTLRYQQSYAINLNQKYTVSLQPNLGLDPVDLATGDFTHQRELLTAGDDLVRGLNLTVSYHGGHRSKNDAKIGYGWTHSYYIRTAELADIGGSYGDKTPIEMASTIVGTAAALDVFANRTGVKDWLGMALVAGWTVDQLKGSAVSIVSGDKIWQFHKQPNGTYTPPPGATQALAKVSNLYQLTERNGPTWKFDSSNRLQQIEDLWHKTLNLTYNTNGDLATVTDAYARALTFTYGANGLSSVSDSLGRTVSFTIDASKNLTLITDAEGKNEAFTYAPATELGPLNGPTIAGPPHCISTYKSGATLISGPLGSYYSGYGVVANYYDPTGRIIAQDSLGDTTKRWYLYYAPGLTIEQEPAISGQPDALTYHYFDSRNREIEVDNALGHRLLTTYDAQDRIVKKERIVGSTVDEVSSWTYDGNHNVLTETDPKGKVVTYVYDGSNQLMSVTDKRGHTQFLQNYNAEHQPTQTTDREGRVVNYTYKSVGDNAAGELAMVTEGGFTTSYGYDSKGAISAISYPGGALSSRGNNNFGDPSYTSDEIGYETDFTYNNRRQPTAVWTPGVGSAERMTTTAYDGKGDINLVTNPRGYGTSTAFSATHKLLTTTLPGSATITTHYNKRDYIDLVTDPLGQPTSMGYDVVGRPTVTTDPLGRTRGTVYLDDQRKTVSQSPSPFNYQDSVTVDERGQVVRNENAMGNYTMPGYDENGNQTSWRDRRGKVWTFSYDNEDRLLGTTSPLNRTTSQTWNARGLLGTITEPSGQTTTLGYDGRRRLTSKTDAVGTIAYGLDAVGNLLTVTQGSAVLTRTFYGSKEVKTYKNANNETISYSYDKNGNLVSLTYPALGSLPAATVTYTYDNRDRLIGISDWSGRNTSYSWDAAGRLTQVLRPNGTVRRLNWDVAGQMKSIEERPASGAPLALRSFHYDAVGRIDKRLVYPQASAWTGPALNAGVDDDNRLQGGVLNYDADGNTLATLLPSGPWGASGTSGNPAGTFTWNARNQLTSATRADNSQSVSHIYDVQGNLIQSTDSLGGTTRWIIDPDGGESPRVLAKIAPNGNVTRYIYGIGLVYEVRQDGSVRYYHYDQVGSTIALTDSVGAVTGRADYSPYGTIQSATGDLANANATPFLFIGAYGVITDSVTGLNYMRARWYSSYLQRFMNEDPSGFAGGENHYSYAGDNPLALIDPNGLRPEKGNKNGASLLTGISTLTPSQKKMFEAFIDDDYLGTIKYAGKSMVESVGKSIVNGITLATIEGGSVLKLGESLLGTAKTATNIIFKTGHVTQHLKDIGLPAQKVEAAIAAQVKAAASASSKTGEFMGRVTVDGKTVEYRAFTLPDGTINVGTYYPKP